MKIISRSAWGATPWDGQPYPTPLSSRSHFLVHYHGGIPRSDRGNANAREIEGIHLANGWSGIGYNFVVGQDGAIREGRGWGLVGAHCPGHNRDGIGVYVAIGGDQEPTAAALAAVRWLYDEACRKTGRALEQGWHGRYYPTACAGHNLIQWVKDGMKVNGMAASPSPTTPTSWTPTGTLTTRQIQQLVGVTADGIYGPATTQAVATLQKTLGITPDGLFGPETERTMALLDDIQADLKAVKTQNNNLARDIATVETWTRKAVNAAEWSGPARTTERLTAVLASTTGVDEATLAAAIADAVSDDVRAAVEQAGSGATPEAIARAFAQLLAQGVKAGEQP